MAAGVAVGNTAQDQECEQGLVHGTLAVLRVPAQVLEFVDRLGGGHGREDNGNGSAGWLIFRSSSFREDAGS